MVVLGLLAGVVVVLLAAGAWWMRIGRRRSSVRVCVSEEEARENAAPLTTAILSGSRTERRGSWRGEDRRRFPAAERRRQVPVHSAQPGRLVASVCRSALRSRCSGGADAFATVGTDSWPAPCPSTSPVGDCGRGLCPRPPGSSADAERELLPPGESGMSAPMPGGYANGPKGGSARSRCAGPDGLSLRRLWGVSRDLG